MLNQIQNTIKPIILYCLVLTVITLAGIFIGLGFSSEVIFLSIGIFYGVIVLANLRLAIALFIPLYLAGAVGAFDLTNIRIPGVNIETLLIMALIIGTAVRFMRDHKKLSKNKLNGPIFLFFIAINTIWTFWDRGSLVLPNYDRLAALKSVILMVSLFFITSSAEVDETWIKRYIWTTIFTGVVISVRDLFLFWQAGGGLTSDWESIRLAETEGFNIVQGNTLLQGLLLALVFSQAIKNNKRLIQIFCFAAAGLFSLDIVLSYYRSALIMAVAIGLVAVYLLRSLKGPVVLAILAVALIIALPSLGNRIDYTFSNSASSIGPISIDTTGRADVYWPRALNVALNNLPVGTGFNQLHVALGSGQGSAFDQYLNWFAELGPIGLIIALWTISKIGIYLWNSIKNEKTDFIRVFEIGLLSGWVGMLVRNVTGDAFYLFWLAIFMLLLGALMSYQESARGKIEVVRSL